MNICLILAASMASDLGPAPTLDVIRAAVRQNITSIRSIHVVFHTSSVGRGFMPGDPDEVRGPTACEWAEQGKQRFYRKEAISGTQIGPTQYSHDGQTAYHLVYDSGNDNRLARVVQSPEINAIYGGHLTPAQFCGLHLPQSEATLSDLISAPEAQLKGSEEIRGVSCWKVDAGYFYMIGKARMHLTAWLDPAHDFLPRRLLIHAGDRFEVNVDGENQQKRDFETLEFQQIVDPVQMEPKWFPKEGRVTYPYGHETITVDRVAINAPLSTAQFRFLAPSGTEVVEETAEPGVVTRRYIAGGGAAIDELITARSKEASSALIEDSTGEERLNAREHSGLSISAIAMVASGCLMTLALIVFVMSRRRN